MAQNTHTTTSALMPQVKIVPGLHVTLTHSTCLFPSPPQVKQYREWERKNVSFLKKPEK
jgi:hypothetical protein